MEEMKAKKAVLYCRVSSKKQVAVGSGLESQEHRCRQYAAAQGYIVDKVFHDDVTGGGDFMNRPGMVSLLRFLKSASDDYVVIFDDLKRFARDTVFHIQLRQRLAAYGASVECLNFKFEDTPEGKFVETVVAAQGELERHQNRRQTLQKMRARLERGYYVFISPVGYRYEKIEGHGKLLVPDEPLASIIREALEGYASGRFQTQAEVMRFLESQPEFPRDSRCLVRATQVTDILTRPVYAGYVEAPIWNIALRKGLHEALISFETYRKIQERLNGRDLRVPARKNINEDFPLRGFILCEGCDRTLTAGWTKGRNTHYPYYLCSNRGCPCYGKSIQRAEIEGAFATLLRQLQPTANLFSAGRAMFKDLWDSRLASGEARARTLKIELKKTEKQIEQFLDRIADTSVPSVVGAYEKRILNLEEQKILIREKIENRGQPMRGFDETLRTALEFLASPWNLWDSERLEDKRMVLKLAFADRLTYVRNEGFRTANLALPFKVLASFSGLENKMVPRRGLEPPRPQSH